jgi:galactokinase
MTDVNWLPAWTRDEGAARARALFGTVFGDDIDNSGTPDVPSQPDGVWSAPGRVNIIGEHTDYNAGLCLPTALPHRTYIALRKRDDDVVRIASAQVTDPWTARLADIAPGQVNGWGAYVAGVAWALREAGHAVGGFDAVVDSGVPFGASLSSSAALECAFAVALDDVYGLGLGATPQGRAQLVDACRRAENDIAGAPTGGLDQSASLLCGQGQAVLLDFRPGLPADEFCQSVPFNLADAGLTLLVIDSRAPHALVDGQYAARRDACEKAAEILGVASLRDIDIDNLDDTLARLNAADPTGLLARRVRHVVTEIGRASAFADLVREGLGSGGTPHEGRTHWAGQLMDASHDSLRDDYEVTVPETDLAVNASREAGAIGARMTGGGFGGSTIALVRADDVAHVANTVAAAFEAAGYTAPAFLEAPPSAPAGRDL